MLVFLSACSDNNVDPGPTPVTSTWKAYATPEDAGWSSALLEVAWQHADAVGSGAVMVIQGDAVVAAWGDISRKFRAHSIRKMLLSALYGSAVEDGLINLGATLEQLGIDDD